MTRRRRASPGGQAEQARRRQAWLDLIQTSGPFITLPVADRAMPNGPADIDVTTRAELRSLVEEMLARRGATRDQLVDAVLSRALDWSDHHRRAADLPASLAEPVPDRPGVVLRPDFAFYAEDQPGESSDDEVDAEDVGGQDGEGDQDAPSAGAAAATTAAGPWRLLGVKVPWGSHPLALLHADGLAASPVDRLARLLRARGVPIGLVTDGRWWALVWAPRGFTTAAAVWDAGLWSEEPETLRAFVALLGRSRFLAEEPKNRLPELFSESLN